MAGLSGFWTQQQLASWVGCCRPLCFLGPVVSLKQCQPCGFRRYLFWDGWAAVEGTAAADLATAQGMALNGTRCFVSTLQFNRCMHSCNKLLRISRSSSRYYLSIRCLGSVVVHSSRAASGGGAVINWPHDTISCCEGQCLIISQDTVLLG